MNCKAMVEAMMVKNYWSSPNGKTSAATLYAAILRDAADHQPVTISMEVQDVVE